MQAFRESTAARIALPFFGPKADQGGLERRRPFSRRTGGSNRLRLLRAHIKPVAQCRAGEESDEPAAFQVWMPPPCKRSCCAWSRSAWTAGPDGCRHASGPHHSMTRPTITHAARQVAVRGSRERVRRSLCVGAKVETAEGVFQVDPVRKRRAEAAPAPVDRGRECRNQRT